MINRIVKAPCETCLYKNGMECFSVKAMLKTACSMEMELYNHSMESMVSEMVIPCKNYVPETKYLQQKVKKVV
ncbi:hypothetical protein IT084_15935 [Desulfallas sp. Bu1-1]|jgi:hypothetical protein|uniref:hypothetical protein n=1 Tax=Desulfallas sp. Bu1-1 TaxID=2787620 RepID=UPI00189EF0C8|nr:hypothetical protein [Desulfallas sp. Bu1-1]MBF7084442.1 hypothetical protein [Desulfallas sp. Bu1-1]